jgi:hypothetical protein
LVSFASIYFSRISKDLKIARSIFKGIVHLWQEPLATGSKVIRQVNKKEV